MSAPINLPATVSRPCEQPVHMDAADRKRAGVDRVRHGQRADRLYENCLWLTSFAFAGERKSSSVLDSTARALTSVRAFELHACWAERVRDMRPALCPR